MAINEAGDPRRLAATGYEEQDCRTILMSPERMVIGLGALGESYGQCRDRFEEILGIAGAGACQPTDGTNFPDYMMASGSFVPQVSALYALSCDGGFGKLVRFESATGNDPIAMSRFVETCLELAGTPSAARPSRWCRTSMSWRTSIAQRSRRAAA